MTNTLFAFAATDSCTLSKGLQQAYHDATFIMIRPRQPMDREFLVLNDFPQKEELRSFFGNLDKMVKLNDIMQDRILEEISIFPYSVALVVYAKDDEDFGPLRDELLKEGLKGVPERPCRLAKDDRFSSNRVLKCVLPKKA